MGYSFSEKDSPLGTPASCRQLLEPQPIDAGKMPALPGNIYLKCYSIFNSLKDVIMEVQPQRIEVHDNSIEYVLCFYSIKDDSGQPASQHVGTFVWNQTDPVYLIPVTNLPGFIKQTITQGVVLPNQTRSTTGPKIISPTNGLEFLNAIKTRYGYGTKLYTSEITQRPKTDIPIEAIR